MKALNKFYISMMNKILSFKDEEKGAAGIVAAVVLILVAVLLAVLFKDEIGKLVKSMFGTIGDNVENSLAKPM